MEPRVSLITLGVSDLDRAVAFYENVLGWKVAQRPPGVAFFDLGGFVLALWGHADLAQDMQLAQPVVSGGYEAFSLAHNLRSVEEVDALFAHLKRHGATIVKPPQKAQWGGYTGYFADPDGHKWEVAYNPHWTVRPDGRITLSPP
ncbi:MAG TPA: VOC family protein [Burkholderiaceae bacterium]|nr:VOC family protein [Burkholderiaceae bacterium]